MNWHIGQEIVVVRSEPNYLKEGDTYRIKTLIECPCQCPGVNIYIGIVHPREYIGVCRQCGCQKPFPAGPIYFNEVYFKPLNELADISELTEVLNEPLYA